GRSVGALARHFGALRTSNSYRRTREELQARMEKSGPVTRFFLNWGRNAKESVKQFFVPNAMIYEQLNIVCTAPIDGHDIHALRETMKICLRMDGPVLMHVVTKKGAGYEPAMEDPERFHGLGAYDIATGASPAKKPGAAPTYTQVFGSALQEEARADERVVALTAAMRAGTGLSAFAEEFPTRFVDGGIAEGHVVGMACGLAYGGAKPVCAIYSTFLQRAVDQVIVDAALAKANVVFAIDRAGVVGEDGPTHHGIFDISYMRMVPGMRMLAPSDKAELANALHTALALEGPVAIRYPRGAAEGVAVPAFESREVFEPGKARLAFVGKGAHGDVPATSHVHDHGEEPRDPGVLALQGSDGVPYVAVLAWGRMVGKAVAAARRLVEAGMDACVWDMRWVKPLDEAAIRAAAAASLVVTVEEGVVAGGAGEGVLAELSRMDLHPEVLNLGIPDAFVTQGTPAELLHLLGLDAEGIEAAIRKQLGR
ncbi:MAG: 1-deoxy-D-xylulose-5-phosphate synthase, partial [Eggerthellaceae bacterium]|nr:1-deoxy-D-xylulose-5-phosphate synthase [Eggerthellaceae bacterium]